MSAIDLDKLWPPLQWAIVFGGVIGGAILTVIGVRNRKPAPALPDDLVTKDDLEQVATKTDLLEALAAFEAGAKRDRHALYGRLDTMQAGFKTDVQALGVRITDESEKNDNRMSEYARYVEGRFTSVDGKVGGIDERVRSNAEKVAHLEGALGGRRPRA